MLAVSFYNLLTLMAFVADESDLITWCLSTHLLTLKRFLLDKFDLITCGILEIRAILGIPVMQLTFEDSRRECFHTNRHDDFFYSFLSGTSVLRGRKEY